MLGNLHLMNSPKKLIVNADDYGACREVNAAIEQLMTARLLGGVSVLANGEQWEAAANFLREQQAAGKEPCAARKDSSSALHHSLSTTASVGIHFNAVEGFPVSTAPEVKLLTGADGKFVGLSALLKRWMLRPLAIGRAIEIEWRAQIERLLQAGLKLTHADSHQHLHAFPLAFHYAARLCRAYAIPALRWPHEHSGIPTRRAGAFALGASLIAARAITPRTMLRHNDHFLGFKRVGAYGLEELITDLTRLPDGLTELALHPSMADGVPYDHLHGDRERRALLDASFLDHLARLQIQLTTWEAATA